MYFLETLQVRAPCHGGVLYSFYIDGMLLEFFMNFLNIENKKFKYIFFNISCFLRVSCYFQHKKKIKNWCKKNFGGGGGGR